MKLLVVVGLVALAAAAATARGAGEQFGLPAWSPDGARVAWVAGSTVWVSDASGRHARALHAFDGVGRLVWESPRSLLLDSDFRLFRLGLGGGAERLASLQDMTFSTDRSARYVVSGVPGCPGCAGPLRLLDLRTGRERRIGKASETMTGPALSPAGTRVAYDTAGGLYVQTIATGAVVRVSRSGSCPVWAPNGRTLAWIDPARHALHVGGWTIRTSISCNTTYPPAFSPDSRYLAYTVGPGEHLAVADLHARRVVLKLPGRVIGHAWSADSRTLLVAVRPGDVGCSSLWLVPVPGGVRRSFARCG